MSPYALTRIFAHLRASAAPLALASIVVAAPPASAQDTDRNVTVHPTLLETMEYRMVGPYRGGRSTAVSGFPDDARHYVMGTTGGGVWTTEDAGESWENVSDGFIDVGSIGAVEVAPGDPNVIWVGTGSAGIRGNVSTGKGVWRSTDRGENWSFVGLERAGLIAKIQVDPRDPDAAFVAALGNPFAKNPERGVYRTRDGGESWEQVLFVADSVGAVDIVMNPRNPRELYAGMWRAERKPWTLIDASRDGGVWKSSDGGDSWTRLTDPAVDNGLPSEALFGRIGLAISPADPDRVWALISAPDPHGGIWRSSDGGESWRKVNRDRRFRQRHWYYSHLEADPQDPNTVYVMNTGLYRSVDGGEDWERISVPHGDVHDLWIHPDDPDAMVVANDGGAQVSLNAGGSWSTMHNQPTAEFYRLEVDNQFPYRLYGAQQDNSTISVASRVSGDLTPEQDWFSVGGAESGHISVHPHPDSAHIVWAGNYIGQIDRSNLKTGESRNMILYPQMGDGVAPKDALYRFQWNAPILISRHDPRVVYHTSQYVHRTTDGGMSWETISPDLTTDNEAWQELPGGPLQHDHTGVEVYTTIFTLAESPADAGELWAGTDDGRVHITRDGGGSWVEITPDDMPAGGTVNSIDLSPNQPGRAVMAVFRYREGDFRPYVFLTENWGQDWDLLTDGENGIPADYPVRVVREDPDRPGLLYAGTEFGMFVSFDEGEHWQSFQRNLPPTPITDLRVHRGDLVVATQGRSFWILDDVSPLHAMRDGVRDEALYLFQPRDVTMARFGTGGDRAPENAPNGVVVNFWLGEDVSEVEVEILDAMGTRIRDFEGEVEGAADGEGDAGAEDEASEDEASGAGASEDEASEAEDPEDPYLEEESLKVKAGMNRFIWDLRYPGPDVIPTAQFSLASTGGMWAPPGTYTIRVEAEGADGEERVQEVRVRVDPDPRIESVTAVELQARFQLTAQVRERLSQVHDAVREIRSIREQTGAVVGRLEEAGYPEELVERIRELGDGINETLRPVEEALIQTKSESGQDPINFPPMLDDQLAYLYSHVNGSYGRPTRGAYQRYEDLMAETSPLLDRVDAVVAGELAAFNAALGEAGVGGVIVRRR
jgi:photosystem II stability/assembly factor-like uncharacterized protein